MIRHNSRFTQTIRYFVIFLLIVLATTPLFFSDAKAEKISGSIYAGFNDHWGVNGNVKPPILITGEVTVENGAKLVIDPGTLVMFSGQGRIEVKPDGELVAKGKEHDWIIFTRLSRKKEFWKEDDIHSYGKTTFEYCNFDRVRGISIWSSDSAIRSCVFKEISGPVEIRGRENILSSSLFMRCKVSGNSLFIINGDCIVKENVFKENVATNIIKIETYNSPINVLLSDNIIKNNRGVGVSVYSGSFDSEITISNNLITDNETGISVEQAWGDIVITNNAIFDNSEYNFICDSYSYQINAPSNYWGSARPDVGKFKGSIKFAPWLDKFPEVVPEENDIGLVDSLIVALKKMTASKNEITRRYAEDRLKEYPKETMKSENATSKSKFQNDKGSDQQESAQAKSESTPERLLTNKDIIQLVKAGLSEDIIVSLIRKSATRFDLTPEALIELKQEGVGDLIIKAMIESSSVEVSQEIAIGTVVVMSEIEEAEVYLNGNYLGKVNEELVLPAGVHTLRITYKDFTVQKTVKIKPREKKKIKISFPGKLHIIYTFREADIYESKLDISIEGEEAISLDIKTKETSRHLFDFEAPEEVTVEKTLILKPGKYKMFVVYSWDSSLHRYKREYTFSIYPAEITLLKTRMDTSGGAFFTTGIFTQIFEKGEKVFEGR